MGHTRSYLTTLFLLIVGQGMATHQRGGELRYNHIGGLTYSIEAHLYLDPLSPADRPEVIINIDGTLDTVPRADSIPLASECATVHCIYITEHTFPGPGVYVVTLVDPNRTAGIANLPNSVDVPLTVRMEMIVSPLSGGGSPRFNAPVTDIVVDWSSLVHDPQADDPDGDSLSFELVTPLGLDADPVPGYQLPDEVTPPGDFTWLDPHSGVFLWQHASMMGLFTIAIRCTEWRDGQAIGSVTRDMTLCVGALPSAVNGPCPSPAIEVRIASDHGSIEVLTDRSAPSQLRLIDQHGRLVRSMGTTGDRTLLDMRACAPGIYSVVVLGGTGPTATARFVVVR